MRADFERQAAKLETAAAAMLARHRATDTASVSAEPDLTTKERVRVAWLERDAAQIRDSKTSELLRRHGISAQTFYSWKKKYGGMNVSEASRLKALEDENRRLKRLVADQALNIQVLKDVLGKEW
ncbi:MAG: transposase [Gemmatimonadaceae bacterium]